MKHLTCLVVSVLGLGCLDADVLYEVEVSGSVHSDDEGPVELWFLHDEWGEGTLETRYMVIDALWLEDATTFSQVLQVPQGSGSGLSVYGWQDTNRDDEHCRPGTDPELSGMVEADEYPAHAVTVSLTLETPCEGPEGL